MASFFSVLIIYMIVPIVSVWAFKRINPYLSKRFPITEEERSKIQYLLSDKNPQRKMLKRYAILDLFLFMPLWGALTLFLLIGPSRALNKGYDVLMQFGLEVQMLILFLPGGFLAMAIAVFSSNYITRLVFKLLNPKGDSSILAYTSRVLNPGTSVEYSIKSTNMAFLIILLAVYPIAAYLCCSRIDLLTRTYYHDRGLFGSQLYSVDELDLKLYPNKNTTYLQIKQKSSGEILLDTSTQKGGLPELEALIDAIK